MDEELEEQSGLVQLAMNKTVGSAIEHALVATMESVQYAGDIAQMVGLILVLSVKSGHTLMARDAAVQSSVAVVVVVVITLIWVVLAIDLQKLLPKTHMVVELVSQWVAEPMKSSMVVFATPNAPTVTLESVQYAGKTVSVKPLMPEQLALRGHMAALLVLP